MRAQCCICADLFENNDDINIACVPCGHVFHDECLMRWVETSNSCPQCRKYVNKKQVIHKLYFDVGDEPPTEERDPSSLQNELTALRAKIRQKDREKKELEDSKDKLRQTVKETEERKSAIQKLLKQEESNSTSLRKQLAYYEAQQKALKTEREQYKRAQVKLAEMQHIEALLSGCESEAESILRQYGGEGKGTAGQLAHFCSIMKREYEQAKMDKKVFKDRLEKFQRELCSKSRLLSECTKELNTLKEHFKQSEDDLKQMEKENEMMKKKIHHLKKAVKSPGSNSTFVASLVEDSPAFTTPAKLGRSAGDDGVIDLENTPDPRLCLTPDLFKDTPTTEAKKHCSENNIKFVKISSASEHNPAKRPRNEANDPNHLAALGSLNIFKKKAGPVYPTVSRKGYDGLGGHTSFTQGLGGKPKGKLATKKPLSKSTLLKNKYARQPDLPTLGAFLD